MKKVLIVEDDLNLGTTMAGTLEIKKMHVCYSEGDGDVMDIFHRFKPDIVLLDVVLFGEKSGFQIAKDIRKNHSTPIIFITALDAADDMKKAFSFENIDYINKPFNIMEVLLRINKILSHQTKFDMIGNYFKLGDLAFYPGENALKMGEKGIRLSNCEAAVLGVLCNHLDLFVSRSEIIMTVWGVDDYKIKEGSLNNIISSLRKQTADEPRLKIESVIKLGVRLILEG